MTVWVIPVLTEPRVSMALERTPVSADLDTPVTPSFLVATLDLHVGLYYRKHVNIRPETLYRKQS